MASIPSTAEPAVTQRPGVEFVQSLARGLAVISTFDADHAAMSLSDVARRSALSRATARRLLHTLCELGYVRTDGRLFSLTPQVLSLGSAYLAGMGLPDVAQPHLERLSAERRESTSIAVLDGDDIVYVARVATRRIMTVAITVGTRFPAYATSMGRVLLAAMPDDELETHLDRTQPRALTPLTITDRTMLHAAVLEVRARGWALVDQELELGLRSMAVPITTADGAVPAALNLSMPAAPVASFDDIAAALRATAAAIAADLQHLR